MRIDAADLVPAVSLLPQASAFDDDEPTGVVGTLKQMPVSEIVQALAGGTKDALVEVKPKGEAAGVIAIEKGRVVYARVRDLLGEDAFFELFCAQRGTFRIRYERRLADLPGPPTANIERDGTWLLLDGARLMDEQSTGRTFPSPTAETVAADARSLSLEPFEPYEAPVEPVKPARSPSGLFSGFFDEAGLTVAPELPEETARFQSLQVAGVAELDDMETDANRTMRERKRPGAPS